MVSLRSLFGKDADVLRDRDFQLLLLASITSPLGASLLSPVLDSLTGPFGVGEARIGLLMAVYTAPAIVMIPVAGVLADRYGRKPVLIAGLTLFGAAGTAIAAVDDFRIVLVLRLLQGIAYTGIGPILITSVGDLYQGAQEATAQGLRFTMVGVSMTVMPLLSGLLVVIAWQYPFVLYAIALPSAVLVFLGFEEPTSIDEGNETDRDRREHIRDLVGLIRQPRVFAILFGRTVPSFLWFGFLTYNSIVVVRLLGGTPGQAGALVALSSIASSIAATQVGRLTDVFATRVVPLIGGVSLAGAGLVLLPFVPSIPWLAVCVLGMGFGFGVMINMFRSMITGFAPEQLRGGLVSVGESIGRLGSTSAPIIMGGAIAVLEPSMGFARALQVVLVAVGMIGVLAGSLAILVSDRSATVYNPVAAD
ncbi:MAG: MFS transporter [Halobacteriales archaeon]|nr:MFS transporter [Halobacteriales archaeon]